jgi:hypothetical protein
MYNNTELNGKKNVERMDPDRLPRQILSYAGLRGLVRPKKRWKGTVTDPLG